MLKTFYWVSSAGALMLYVLAGATGTTFGEEKRMKLPADARQAPGGYRSFHFWHSGIRGGK